MYLPLEFKSKFGLCYIKIIKLICYYENADRSKSYTKKQWKHKGWPKVKTMTQTTAQRNPEITKKYKDKTKTKNTPKGLSDSVYHCLLGSFPLFLCVKCIKS